jgi:hypothetical protein
MRASVLRTVRRLTDGYRRFNQASADEALPRIVEIPLPLFWQDDDATER